MAASALGGRQRRRPVAGVEDQVLQCHIALDSSAPRHRERVGVRLPGTVTGLLVRIDAELGQYGTLTCFEATTAAHRLRTVAKFASSGDYTYLLLGSDVGPGFIGSSIGPA